MWNKIHVETKLLILVFASMFFITAGINGLFSVIVYSYFTYGEDIDIYVLIFSIFFLAIGGLTLYNAHKIYKKEEEKSKYIERKLGMKQRKTLMNKSTLYFFLGSIIFILGLICCTILFNPWSTKNYIMSIISYLLIICGTIISIWSFKMNNGLNNLLTHSYEFYFAYLWLINMILISIAIPVGFIINPI